MTEVLTSYSTAAFESSSALSNKVIKNVQVAPKSVQSLYVNPESIDNNTMTFMIQNNSNNLLSRRMVLEFPITVTIPAATNDYKTVDWFCSPRSNAFSRAIQSMVVEVNGEAITVNPTRYIEPLDRIDRFADELHHGVLGASGNTPDYFYLNGKSSTVGAPLDPDGSGDDSLYNWRQGGLFGVLPPRLGATDITQTVAGVHAETAGRSAIVYTITLRYALNHPVFSNSAVETLANVNTLKINMTLFDSEKFRRMFMCSIPRSSQAAVNQVLTPAFAWSTTKTDYQLKFLSINPSVFSSIPNTVSYPSNFFSTREIVYGAIANNTDKDVSIPTQSFSHVPSHILLWVSRDYGDTADETKTQYQSDYYATISSLAFTVNGDVKSFVNDRLTDHYLRNCKNGMKLPLKAFESTKTNQTNSFVSSLVGTGCPLIFKPEDFGYELKAGLQEPFNISCTFKAKQVTGAAGNWTVHLAAITPGVVTIDKSGTASVKYGVSLEEYTQALQQASQMTMDLDSMDESAKATVLGGGISNYFRLGGDVLQLAGLVGMQPELALYGTALGKSADLVDSVQSRLGSMNVGSGLSAQDRTSVAQLRAKGILI